MHGPKECFVPVRQDASQVIVSYEKVADGKKNAFWYEVYFNKKRNAKPTIEQVKQAVFADINAQVKEKIVSGFVWNEIPVWLSEENQMNFAQAVVPATFKIGEQDGTPVYLTFETQEDMKAFSDACTQWKQQCLQEGWHRKDAIDWTPYEEALEKMNA